MSRRVLPSNKLAKNAAEGARKVVRAVMRRLNYRWSDLARLTPYTESSLTTHYSRGFPVLAVRVAIENAIGAALFTTPAIFKARQHQKDLLGIDPVLATRTQLRAIARRCGLSGATHLPNKRVLIEKLCARLEVQSLTRSKPQPTPRHE